MQVNPSPALPTVGRCIYCDTTKGRLTREHIIPRLLGGNLTLLKASCDDCAEVTKRIEGYAGRRIFQDVRLKHGFRIKDRPTHLPMLDEFTPSPEMAPARLVPTKHVPGMLFLLNPEPPGLLTGKPPGSTFNGEIFFCQISDGQNDTEEVRKQLGFPGKLYRETKIDYIGRLIAKISLGLGVAACGIDGFIPTVRDIILKDGGDWHHWIGGTTAEMDEFPPPSGATVLHRTVVFGRQIRGSWFLVVQLQLLSYLGAPIYTAIVGKLNQAGLDKLNARK